MSVSHRVDSVKEHAEKRKQAADLTAASEIAFVVLAEAEQIDAVTAAEHASLFSKWAYPVNYAVGAIRRYNGKLYKGGCNLCGNLCISGKCVLDIFT